MTAEASVVRDSDPFAMTGKPSGFLVATPLVLIWLYLFAEAIGSRALIDVANICGPFVLGCVALGSGFNLLRRYPGTVWTPYAWFLLAIVLFYSVGPLIYPLADSQILTHAQSFLPVTPRELLRTNLLNAVGILAIFLGFRGAHKVGRRPVARVAARTGASTLSPKSIALGFLVVGGLLEYAVVLPFEFGMTRFVLPGVVKNLDNLYLLGLMVLAYVVAIGNRQWRLLLFLLWGIQIFVSVLVFSKHQLILTLALPILGAYLADRHTKRLLVWGVVFVAVYFSVGRLVLYGRSQIYSNTGSINQASLTQRLYIVQNWFAEGMPSAGAEISTAGNGWARLNYAPEQALAISRYNQGYNGHTLQYIGIVLIPRFLWPDKPVTTDMAVDFYESVTGRRGSHLGLGLFGEGYWDYGWVGVVALGLLAGAMFAILSELTLTWMRRRAFEYMPSVLIGVNMGVTGTTQFFVNSIFGATALVIVYTVAVWLLVRLVGSSRRDPPQLVFRTYRGGR